MAAPPQDLVTGQIAEEVVVERMETARGSENKNANKITDRRNFFRVRESG